LVKHIFLAFVLGERAEFDELAEVIHCHPIYSLAILELL
jgi:hypothetical protein